jgi:hypothetical protein
MPKKPAVNRKRKPNPEFLKACRAISQGLLKTDEENYRASLHKNLQKQKIRLKRLWKSGVREIPREPTILGNPLYPCQAFLQCYEEGLSPPDWVMEYFATIARELCHLSFHDWEPLNLESKTAEIFGVKTPGRSGRGNIISKYRNTLYERQLAIQVRQSVEARKKLKHAHETVKLKHVYEDVAKDNGTSEPTVRRAWKKTSGPLAEAERERWNHGGTDHCEANHPARGDRLTWKRITRDIISRACRDISFPTASVGSLRFS